MRYEKRTRNAIDVLKGISIIFVVLGHVVSSYRNSNMLTDAVVFNFSNVFVYSFHMPLFFAVSGYLAGKSEKEATLATAVSKMISLGIPYIIFSIAAFALKFVAKSVVNSQISFKDLLMIWLYPISYLWFLYALLLISMISLFFKRLGMNKHPLVIIVVSLICKIFVCFILGTNLLQSKKFSSCILFDVFRFYFWYALGEYSAGLLNNERKQSLQNIKNRYLGLALLLFVGSVYFVSYRYGIKSIVFDLLFECWGIGIFALIALKVSTSKTLEMVGKQTLPIYLLHGYVVSFVRIMLSKLQIPLICGFVPLVLGAILGVISPLLVYVLSTKIKGLDFVFYPQRYIDLKK